VQVSAMDCGDYGLSVRGVWECNRVWDQISGWCARVRVIAGKWWRAGDGYEFRKFTGVPGFERE